MLNVVSAAIVAPLENAMTGACEWRMLLTQRDGLVSYPWHWCTPGGKVEAGESLKQALQRELREEICFCMSDTCLIDQVVYEHVGKRRFVDEPYRLTCFAIRLASMPYEILPVIGQHVAGIGWFAHYELDSLNLAGADKEKVGILKALL